MVCKMLNMRDVENLNVVTYNVVHGIFECIFLLCFIHECLIPKLKVRVGFWVGPRVSHNVVSHNGSQNECDIIQNYRFHYSI